MLMESLNIKYMILKFKLKINIRIMVCKIIRLKNLGSTIFNQKSNFFDFFGDMLL